MKRKRLGDKKLVNDRWEASLHVGGMKKFFFFIFIKAYSFLHSFLPSPQQLSFGSHVNFEEFYIPWCYFIGDFFFVIYDTTYTHLEPNLILGYTKN